MQALPYDWRISVSNSDFNTKLGKLLDKNLEITGKRAIITAHSLGTLFTYNYLLNTDQEHKDKTIYSFVPVSGPLLGATRAIHDLILGFDEI